MAFTEQIDLIANTSQAFAEVKKFYAELGNGAETSSAKAKVAIDFLEKSFVTSADKQSKAVERQIASLERYNTTLLKTPIERINAQREKEVATIQKTTLSLDEQAAAIKRVNAVYEQRIALATAESAATVSATKAATAFDKAVTGSMFNSNRAAATFMTTVLGLGPAMQAAFQVVGALAFIGIIDQVFEKVQKLIKEAKEAPRRIQSEYEDLFSESTKANDAMEVTNIKLANQIAKLEHKPQNLVKEALLEAKQAADELAESLTKDNAKLVEFLEKNQHGFFGSFAGTAPTTDLTEEAKKYSNKLIDIRYKGSTGEFTPAQVIEAEKAAATERRRQLQRDIRETQADMKRANYGHTPPLPDEESPFFAKFQYEKYALSLLGPEEQKIENAKTAGDLKGKLPQAEAAATAAKYTESLRQELAKAQEGELNGEEKINAQHEEKIRHLKEEGQYTQANLNIVEKIQTAQKAAFEKEENRKIASAQFAADHGLRIAAIGNVSAISAAQRKASGDEYGETDIQSDYDTRMKLAREAYRQDLMHVKELFDANRNASEVEAAGIAANAHWQEASDKAETERKIQLIDLEKRRSDEQKKAAADELSHQQRMRDIEVGGQISSVQGTSEHQRRLRSIRFGSGGTLAARIGMVNADQQDSDAVALDRYTRNEENIANKRLEFESKLADSVGKDKEEWQKKLNALEDEHVKNVEDKRKTIEQDRYTAEEKIAELQMRQFEEIKGKTEGLLHTLFINPKGFGSQLKNTVRDAALRPIEDKLSTMIAGPLQQLFGTTMKPIDRLYKDPLPVAVVNMPGASRSGGSIAAGGYTPAVWGAGMTPATLAQIMTGGGSVFSGTPHGEGTSESIDFGGGAVNLGGGSKMYGGSSSGSSGILNQIMSGGFSKGPGGSVTRTAFNPKNFLKNTDWGIKGGTDAEGNQVGAFRHGVAGAGIMAGGTMLAENGLLGNNRGTTKGIFEGAAGGAMIGFEFGGPLGAAVGGAIGAGIGIGEKVAGVESPQNEAKRLVKQQYHVNIDNSMADQIVKIAQSKYAGHVSIAVRDPDVRKMLELYAAGTGQNMPQSATTPHGGSLLEQGGTLYQAQSYKYGAGYAFQSNLPVAGGFSPTMYPNPGGSQPMALSINISGQGAAQFLQGSVVTPEFVNAQWSSSMASSNGRVGSSAMMQMPGLITA